MEKEADQFASSFLLPSESFKKSFESVKLSLDSILSLKKIWNVSLASILYRSRELGIINADEYLRLIRQKSYRGWTKVEPFDDLEVTEVPKPHLMLDAFNMLEQANIITGTDLANEIDDKFGVMLPNSIISEVTSIPYKKLVSFNESNVIKLKNFYEKD